MLDIKNLDKYVVVRTGSDDPATVEDLRELEGPYGDGVYALFSDTKESIIAFAFEPTRFDEAQAQQYVRDIQKPKTTAFQEFLKGMRGLFAGLNLVGGGSTESPKALRSFDEIRSLVDAALETRYQTYDSNGDSNYSDIPWIWDMGTANVITSWKGEKYAIPYSIDEADVVLLGDPVKVDQEWIKPDGAPVMLHMFNTKLGPGDAAEDDEDDGLIWKEIIHPGQWFKALSGHVVEVTTEIIEAAFDAWENGLPKLISVPADDHHEWTNGVVPVESNRGFVEKLKLIGESLFGGFKLTDPLVAFGVEAGNIADCSVSLIPNIVHPDSGDEYPWVLQHVLLTNSPLVQDLEPFGVLPVGASTSGPGGFVLVKYQGNQEVENMGDKDKKPGAPEADAPEAITLDAGQKAVLALNISAEDIQAMVAASESVRQQSRDLEITRVVRAMENLEQHDGVVVVEKFRHYPVVCTAVETALKEQPSALSLSADSEGKTGLDAVILGIVNAIPAEGRMAMAADGAPAGNLSPEDNDPTLQGDEKPVTAEQIDELDRRLR